MIEIKKLRDLVQRGSGENAEREAYDEAVRMMEQPNAVEEINQTDSKLLGAFTQMLMKPPEDIVWIATELTQDKTIEVEGGSCVPAKKGDFFLAPYSRGENSGFVGRGIVVPKDEFPGTEFTLLPGEKHAYHRMSPSDSTGGG